MSEQVPVELLAHLEALANEATAGPWLVWGDGDVGTA